MTQQWTCPRGHRWQGGVQGSVANPRTLVLCPICGAAALAPAPVKEAAPESLEATLLDVHIDPPGPKPRDQ